jgi:alpha-beta hydrolase superfamily lysophospholipase
MPGTESATRDVVITADDGHPIHARFWPVRAPRGILVIAHGFGEHGGCYSHVAELLGDRAGLEVLAPDLRGHGRSPGRRGVVRHYDDLTSDFLASLTWAARHRPGLPLFALGHSNGGQVVLRAALGGARGLALAGLILSNPSLRLAIKVPRHQFLIGRFLLRFAPRVTLYAPIEPEKLSRDPQMMPFYLEDPLRHGRISAPLFFGMIEGGERILGQVEALTTPTLMIVGGADPITDPEACRLAFDRLGSQDKTLLLYPHMLHEPLNELGRAGVHADLVSWIDQRLPSANFDN